MDRAADEPKGLEHDDFVEDRRHRLTRLALERELITLARAAEIIGLTLEQMRDLVSSWSE